MRRVSQRLLGQDLPVQVGSLQNSGPDAIGNIWRPGRMNMVAMAALTNCECGSLSADKAYCDAEEGDGSSCGQELRPA